MQHFDLVTLIQGELWERLDRLVIVERMDSITPIVGKATTLIGMRRAGKTFCLYHLLQQLKSRGIPRESILFLNLEDDRLQIRNAEGLTKTIGLFFSEIPANYKRQTYILLDEVQSVKGWERVARRLIETDRCQLWLTGSSAQMLSREVATSFRGRSIAHEVWPFSFSETARARNVELPDPTISFSDRDHARESLVNYLICGGFPEVIAVPAMIRRRILDDYRQLVILRDVIERHRVTNILALDQLVSTVIANSGRLLSVNKTHADFKSRGIAVGKDTLFEYLSYLEDAYLTFLVPPYSESLRARSTAPKKVFCVDTGMVANYSIRPRADLGRLFENLIYIELRRAGYRVYYYTTQSGAEVDFVAVDTDGHRSLIQVCYDSGDPDTLDRETRALKEAQKELKCGGGLITPLEYLKNELLPMITNGQAIK